MAVSLSKGGNVSLSKAAPNLQRVLVGLGWDPRVTDGQKFDLDASVFVLGADGKVLEEKAFVFYGNKEFADGAVKHTGDNTTGDGQGDDEQVLIDLPKLPATATRIAFVVTIHEAEQRGNQTFGQVSNSFIRVVDDSDQKELGRYDLGEDASTQTAMVFGEIYRNGEEWKFKAIGDGYAGGLAAAAATYGINAS